MTGEHEDDNRSGDARGERSGRRQQEREDAAELTGSLATRLVDAIEDHEGVTRRAVLGTVGVAGAGAIGISGSSGADESSDDDDAHGNFGPTGEYEDANFDPHAFLRAFNTGKSEQSGVLKRGGNVEQEYIERDGKPDVRRFELYASKETIEIAPGIEFEAWTYNGQVPGPTLRVTEGDIIEVKFRNAQDHPHTIHPHVKNLNPRMDGIPQNGPGIIEQGDEFTYRWQAKPAGCHFYHCHSLPLKEHIHRGLYGAIIVDPDPERVRENPRDYVNYQGPMTEEYREYLVEQAELRNHEYRADEVDELVMVMNGFDTNFDGDNEVYAANTQAFAYGVGSTDGFGSWDPSPDGTIRPIEISKSQRQRVYLINTIEFDPINSFHTHSQFFEYYNHGTTLQPTHKNIDTVMQCQAQRGIIELDYSDHQPGLYMFHAHQSEFAELGWMSFFEVTE